MLICKPLFHHFQRKWYRSQNVRVAVTTSPTITGTGTTSGTTASGLRLLLNYELVQQWVEITQNLEIKALPLTLKMVFTKR